MTWLLFVQESSCKGTALADAIKAREAAKKSLEDAKKAREAAENRVSKLLKQHIVLLSEQQALTLFFGIALCRRPPKADSSGLLG